MSEMSWFSDVVLQDIIDRYTSSTLPAGALIAIPSPGSPFRSSHVVCLAI